MKTSGASLPCNHVILPEWSDVGYAWKRGVHCEYIRSKSEETLCRLLITMVEETWYKKVLSRPRKAGNESEERICWGREFQMEGETKENDLRHTIGTMWSPVIRLRYWFTITYNYYVIVRHCGLVVSTPAWDGTGCEFDSWQCWIYIPCSLSLRLLGSLRGSLGTYGLTQKLC